MDSRIVNVLEDYEHEFGDDLNQTKGVIIVRFDKQESDKFYLAFKVYRDEVERDPPSFFCLLNEKVVLVYTGIEPYLRYNERSFVLLFAKLKQQMTETGVTYSPIVWEVDLLERSYEKHAIDRLPW